MNWQPISTAPVVPFGHPPVDVLLYGGSIGVCSGRACSHNDGWIFASVSHVNGNLAEDRLVSHWMPLPDPPAERAK
jgi:hypothetical protein